MTFLYYYANAKGTEILKDVIVGVLSNVVFWLGFGIIIWLAILLFQAKFIKFFGLNNKRELIIYLSNLWEPTEEKPIGFLISGHEYHAVNSINDLFGSAPLRLPELVRGLIDGYWLSKKIDIDIKVSPLSYEEIVLTNLIIVGGATRNRVRRYYVNRNIPLALTIWEDMLCNRANSSEAITPYVKVVKGKRKDEKIYKDYNLALIERVRDEIYGTTIFMCNGLRADSSWAATEYLVRHWNELDRKYKGRNFALCLGFTKSDSYMEKYKAPEYVEALFE